MPTSSVQHRDTAGTNGGPQRGWGADQHHFASRHLCELGLSAFARMALAPQNICWAPIVTGPWLSAGLAVERILSLRPELLYGNGIWLASSSSTNCRHNELACQCATALVSGTADAERGLSHHTTPRARWQLAHVLFSKIHSLIEGY